jgi:hypothetical protein
LLDMPCSEGVGLVQNFKRAYAEPLNNQLTTNRIDFDAL